jgi:hypothetical protein
MRLEACDKDGGGFVGHDVGWGHYHGLCSQQARAARAQEEAE